MLKKIIIGILLIGSLMVPLSGCGQSSEDEQLLKSPFIMEVYKTYLNGSPYHTYPDKVFETDELFNILNSASAEAPFEVSRMSIEYIIEMENGENYTTFKILNDGTVSMNYNFLFNSEFYLTQTEYENLISLIETEA